MIMHNTHTNDTATAEETTATAEPISATLTIKLVPGKIAIESSASIKDALDAVNQLRNQDSLPFEDSMKAIILVAINHARDEAQKMVAEALFRRRLASSICDCPKCVARRAANKADSEPDAQ